MPITTGPPKKRETFAAQVREYKNTAKQVQEQQPHWHQQTPRDISRKDLEGDSRRSGSDSNADTGARGH